MGIERTIPDQDDAARSHKLAEAESDVPVTLKQDDYWITPRNSPWAARASSSRTASACKPFITTSNKSIQAKVKNRAQEPSAPIADPIYAVSNHSIPSRTVHIPLSCRVTVSLNAPSQHLFTVKPSILTILTARLPLYASPVLLVHRRPGPTAASRSGPTAASPSRRYCATRPR